MEDDDLFDTPITLGARGLARSRLSTPPPWREPPSLREKRYIRNHSLISEATSEISSWGERGKTPGLEFLTLLEMCALGGR
jgi:hypothetical protein